ncbi:MAG: M24 family metallopeptidase [Chloroflexi bacterium]|nr:M24 family metallopeptidase [Chloroflexota bacterium]
MAQPKRVTGGFSEKERDRRWKHAQTFLAIRGLDALLILGANAREGVERYLSNWPGSTTLFPVKGDPILLSPGLGDMLAFKQDIPDGDRPWIKDVRTGARPPQIIQAIRDKGLEKGRIGVVGIGPMGAAWEGWIPFGIWSRVARTFPDCRFEDVGQVYGEAILPKSEEELAYIKHAANALEEGSANMLKVVRPGASEYDVWTAFGKAAERNVVELRWPELGSGPNTVGGRPLWLQDIGDPRKFNTGDVVVTEVYASCRSYDVQVQMCAAIPPLSREFQQAAEIARACYEAGLSALRPGNTFEAVVDAMEVPLNKRKDTWHVTPMTHSMCPMVLIGRTGLHIERMPGVENFPGVGTGHIRGGERVLQPGMVFELEPNICIGLNRVHLGGLVQVTEGKPKELNKLSTQMRVAGK